MDNVLPDGLIHLHTVATVRVGRPSADRTRTEIAEAQVLINDFTRDAWIKAFDDLRQQIDKIT